MIRNTESQPQEQSNVNINVDTSPVVISVNDNTNLNANLTANLTANVSGSGDVVDLLNMNVDESGQVINDDNGGNIEDNDQSQPQPVQQQVMDDNAIQQAIDNNIGSGSGVATGVTDDNDEISNMIAQVNQTGIDEQNIDDTNNAEDANRL